MREVCARVVESNDASMHVLENVGFQTEWRLRDHYFVDGDWYDIHLYGPFRSRR